MSPRRKTGLERFFDMFNPDPFRSRGDFVETREEKKARQDRELQAEAQWREGGGVVGHLGKLVSSVMEAGIALGAAEAYGPSVRAALAWSEYDAHHMEEHVRAHCAEILDRAAEIRADFLNNNHPFATFAACESAAAWALANMQGEVEHYLPNTEDRTQKNLASIFWKYRVHEHDRLLRRARELERENVAGGASGRRRPRALSNPDAEKWFTGEIGRVESVHEGRARIEQMKAARRDALHATGLSEDEIEADMRQYAADADRIYGSLRREAGLE
jgi:hypothetical protein